MCDFRYRVGYFNIKIFGGLDNLVLFIFFNNKNNILMICIYMFIILCFMICVYKMM